jgi:hypothetical protein
VFRPGLNKSRPVFFNRTGVPQTEGMSGEEVQFLGRLMKEIEGLKEGLDPQYLAAWYHKVADDAKAAAPRDLADSIGVVQDSLLPMKFSFQTSKRAVTYVLRAIERNLEEMPFATRLYFQKLAELIQAESMR